MVATNMTAGGASPEAHKPTADLEPKKETTPQKYKRIGYSILMGSMLMIVLMQWKEHNQKVMLFSARDGTASTNQQQAPGKYWTNAEHALERASGQHLPMKNVWKEQGTVDVRDNAVPVEEANASKNEELTSASSEEESADDSKDDSADDSKDSNSTSSSTSADDSEDGENESGSKDDSAGADDSEDGENESGSKDDSASVDDSEDGENESGPE
jgi:hypothetical protein